MIGGATPPADGAGAAAEAYFAALWQRASAVWRAGNVAGARMAHGATLSVDYCLSTIARLGVQPGAPLAAVQRVQTALAVAGPGQFVYPPASLHVSLLGCTPRYASADAFTPDQIGRIQEVCARVLSRSGPVRLDLRGVGVQGCQVLVQVIPRIDAWARLRAYLEDALVEIGERPIAYPDKRPIHLNVLRMTDTSPDALSRMLAAVEALRDAPLGALTIARVELVITDFVVSPRHARTLATFDLT